MAEAEDKYRKLLAKQSKTLVDAVNEYRRRYGREPPRGFGDWWKFAVEHDVKMMDEYDGMVEDLAPFWELPGEELRRRAVQVGNFPTVDLVRLRDGKAVLMNLPDMDFPINALAEGRVLVPWEHLGEFDAGWGGGNGGVWSRFRQTCHPESPARRTNPVNYLNSTNFASESGDDFHFSKTVDNKFDFCSNPAARFNQGHFFSNWRAIQHSPGFSDIRIPSHYNYIPTAQYSYGWDHAHQVHKELDDMEIPWQHKNNTIFWRGRSTGGGNTPGGFAPGYQHTRKAVVFSRPPNSSSYEQANVPRSKLNDEIMDVAFVKSTNDKGYPGGYEALRKAHRFAAQIPLYHNWKYKYLVDLDGMGYSARFLAFLASDSAVIKSTVYSESFSDWIQPWLHYIPLSQGYHELYNIYPFFSGPTESMLHAANSSALSDNSIIRHAEDGDRRLRRIAQAGKEWKRTVGRTIDMEVYVYRLCLEWGRLWSEDRDSMNFTM
ncbi:glycosyltransferase family 90 protein [Rickenella mellea]|uniref:Glycosyltransferase family 90 protein n=1 Tax=Rickenella mellea TaxID=50990 RepID=A0A4Y7PL24_9AGAM|nr:glycosyltransferase family 90 protein [Rickenella mellea]